MRTAVFVFASALLVAGAAAGQVPDETEHHADEAHAREAFRLGSALAKQGQWAEALAAFQRAARLRPHPAIEFNIGYAERALGHLTRARRSLLSATRGALGERKGAEAEAYLAEIESKLVTLAVTVTTPDTAIAVDGRPLEVESTGPRPVLVAGTRGSGPGETPPSRSFDLRLDPGEHLIVLARPRGRDVVLTKRFRAGESATLEVGAALDEAEPRPTTKPPAAAPPAPLEARLQPEPDAASESTRIFWPAWVGFGVGAAGVAAGSTFGLMAVGNRADLDDACPDPGACPRTDERSATLDDLRTSSTVSTVAFVVGGVGAAFGVVWLLLAPGSPDPQSSVLGPIVSPGLSGVRGRF